VINRLVQIPTILWLALVVVSVVAGSSLPSTGSAVASAASFSRNLAVLSITGFLSYWVMRFFFGLLFITAGLALLSQRNLANLLAFSLILCTLGSVRLLGQAFFQRNPTDDLVGYVALPVGALILHRLMRQLTPNPAAA